MHSFPNFIVGATGCLHAIRRTEQPRHVAGKGAHGLEAFSIEGGIAGDASVDYVPILRGHDRHVHHLEGHVQRLEHGSSTTSANLPEMRLQTSSSKTHRPRACSLHCPQAMHPRMGLLPIQTISLSMPSTDNSLATSLKAIDVLPSFRGLPFIRRTFISCIVLCYYIRSLIRSKVVI